MSAPTTRVTAVQTVPAFGELERNRCRTVEAVRAHADSDLVVLPELATSGYVFESESERDRLSEPTDGPTAAAWRGVAAETDTWIVGGFPEAAGGATYNSSLLVSPDGVEGVYRKTHLWNEEERWFDPGESIPVFETPFGRVGIQICNDLWFPETTTTQAIRGADLIAVPTNWVSEPADRPGGWTVGLHQALAHANANRVFLACADRAGTERGAEFMGQSALVDPDGRLLAGPGSKTGPDSLTAACDLSAARDKQLTERDDALADRRPELYDCGLDGTE